MFQSNIHINYKAQKSFINILATLNAFALLIIAAIIPVVYTIMGQIENLFPMPIVTYVFMVFVRIFILSQLLLACFAIKARFKLFNEAFSRNVLCNHRDPLCIQKSALRYYGSIFHQLCDSVEAINQSLTFQFIPLVPHVLVTDNIAS